MGDAITVEWRSFMLRPSPETRRHEAFARYTESWRRPAEMEPAARFTVWSSGAEPPSHSLPALVAAKLAATFGDEAYRAFHHALLEAYFTHNRTISDRDVLIDVAATVGMNADEFATGLDEQQRVLANTVIDEHNQAIAAGITAVPTVVVGGALAVPGAQDVDTYERLVERLLAKRAANGGATSRQPGGAGGAAGGASSERE